MAVDECDIEAISVMRTDVIVDLNCQPFSLYVVYSTACICNARCLHDGLIDRPSGRSKRAVVILVRTGLTSHLAAAALTLVLLPVVAWQLMQRTLFHNNSIFGIRTSRTEYYWSMVESESSRVEGRPTDHRSMDVHPLVRPAAVSTTCGPLRVEPR